jgi:hypothetical protein
MHAKETKQGEKVKDRACYYRHHGWPIERISMLVNYIGDLFFTPLKKPSFIFLYSSVTPCDHMYLLSPECYQDSWVSFLFYGLDI